MTFRTDVTIDWIASPRVVEVAEPSTEITIQDLYDTTAILQARVYNTVFDPIVSAGGKESLGGGVQVGVTLTLQNAQLKFEDRLTNTRCEVRGGNLVAVDGVGAEIDPTAFSAFVNAVIAQSSSATLIDTATSLAETTALAGTTASSILTGLTEADDFYSGSSVHVIDGGNEAVRKIDTYLQVNGELILDTDLPFTPTVGSRVLIQPKHETPGGRVE